MSGILNAARARVPVLVTVGQQVQDLLPGRALPRGELVELSRPLAKGAWEVTRAGDLPRLLALAVRTAREPPSGPVVLSLPLDVQVAAGTAPARAGGPGAPGAAGRRVARPGRRVAGRRARPGGAGRRRGAAGRRVGGAGGRGRAPRGADPGRAPGRHGAAAHRPSPLARGAAGVRVRDRAAPRAPRRGARRGDARVPPVRRQPRQRPPVPDGARAPGGGPPRGGQGPRARRRPRGGRAAGARGAARAPGPGSAGGARAPRSRRRRGGRSPGGGTGARGGGGRRRAGGPRRVRPAPSPAPWSATTWWWTRPSRPGAACGP